MTETRNRSSCEDELLRCVRRLTWRLRLVRFTRLLVRCLFYSLVAGTVGIAATKLTPLRCSPVTLMAAFGAASVPLAVLFYLLDPITPFTAAVIADQRLRLKERISSALELISAGATVDKDERFREWREVVIRNAHQAIREVDLGRVFPFRFGRECRYVWAPVLLAAVMTLFLPDLDWWTGKRAEARSQLQEEAVRRLKKLTEQQLLLHRERRDRRTTKLEKIYKEIEELSRELDAGRIERRELMSKLAKLSDRIKIERAALLQEQLEIPPLKSLPQGRLPAQLATALEESDFATAAIKLQEITKTIGQNRLTGEDRERLSKELAQLAQSLDRSPLGDALKAAAVNLAANNFAGAMQALNMAGKAANDMRARADQVALLDRWMRGIRASRATLAGATNVCLLCGGSCAGACKGAGNAGAMAAYGRGRGGRAPFQETQTESIPSRIPGQFQDAPIAGAFLVRGLPGRQDASVEFSDVVLESRQAAEDALNQQRVPLVYRSCVRRYFDMLEMRNTTGDADGG